MRWWRVSYRLTGFTVVTLVLYGLRIIPRPLLRRRGNADRAWGRQMFGLWARLIRRLIGMRIRISGPVPGPASFLVTNHLGYVDVVLLANFLPANFVAKAEVAGWPLLGRAVRSVGTIFIDRKRRRDVQTANDAIVEALQCGDTVILFAEGTSSSGDRVLPMRPSLLEVPAARRLPVTYAAIRYATPDGGPSASDAVCWWGDMKFFSHFVGLLGLRGFDAYLRFGEVPVIEGDRKKLAARLYDLISAEHLKSRLT